MNHDQIKLKTNTGRIHSLNNLRGIACAIVVFSHMFLLFWINNIGISGIAHVSPVVNLAVDRLPIWSPVFDLVKFLRIDLGNYGVGIFFLVSGYLIPISLEKLARKDFIISRFFRIFPVFWVSLLLLVLSQGIYSIWFQKSFYLTAKDFLSNFFMIRDFMWLPFLENATWTLEVEIKFYLVCAILLFSKNSLSLIRLFLIAIFIGLFFAIPLPNADDMYAAMPNVYKLTYTLHSQIIFIPYMFVGVLCYYFDKNRIEIYRFFFGSAFLLSIFVFARENNLNPAVHPESFTVSYFLALFTFMAGHFSFRNRQGPRFLTILADISYPLYLLHGTLGYVLMTILYPIIKVPELVSLTCLILTASLATLTHKLIEKRGINFGRKMIARKHGN